MGCVLRARSTIIFICHLQINILENPVAAVKTMTLAPALPGQSPPALSHQFPWSRRGSHPVLITVPFLFLWFWDVFSSLPYPFATCAFFQSCEPVTSQKGLFLCYTYSLVCSFFTEVQNCGCEGRCVRPPGLSTSVWVGDLTPG